MSTNLKNTLSTLLVMRQKPVRWFIYLNTITFIVLILGLIFNPNIRSNLVNSFLNADRIGEVLLLILTYYCVVYLPIRVLNAAYLTRGINENFHNRMATRSKVEGSIEMVVLPIFLIVYFFT